MACGGSRAYQGIATLPLSDKAVIINIKTNRIMQNKFYSGRYGRIIIHTPHAGTELPIHFHVVKHIGAVKHNCAVKAFYRPFYMQLTDHYTDKLFSCIVHWPNAIRPSDQAFITQVSFPYSRLFCDVERLPNDPLEEKGLGIHYNFSKFTNRGDNWYLLPGDAFRLYNEHQAKLLACVDYPFIGRSLILDCHSFSERDNILCPNAHEYKDIDICLGFNEDETKPSEEFIDSVKNFFTDRGYRVEYNKPFSNSKTVQNWKHWERPNYHSLMIEVNKHCYMNEDTLEITAGYYKLHAELQELYKLLLNY